MREQESVLEWEHQRGEAYKNFPVTMLWAFVEGQQGLGGKKKGGQKKF